MKKLIGSVLALAAGVCVLAAPAHAGELRWSGEVDDTATIALVRGDVVLTSSNKNGIRHERHTVSGELPRHDVTVSLDQQRGRGRIWIVQQPSAGNGYRAIVRIEDKQSGSDRYAFTLHWDDRGGHGDRGDHDGHGGHHWNH